MFEKKILIIFIGLCVVVAMLILGWSVFVKTEVIVPERAIVVSDEVVGDKENDDIVFNDAEDDNLEKNVPEILFSCIEKGSSIWLINNDGSNLKKVVSKNLGNLSSAVLSFKKDKLAYISIEAEEKVNPFSSRPKIFGIRIIDLATDESTLVVSRDRDQAGIGHPKFSPDGNYLAYFVEEAEKDILYVTKLSDLTTNKIIELTSIYKASATEIRWSPDGKKIVYIHDNNICTTDLNGNAQKIVFGGEPEKGEDLSGHKWDIFTIWDISFSLDGKQIRYIKNANKFKYTKDSNRFIVDVDGKNNKQLRWVDFEIDKDKYVRVVDLVPNSNKALILESWPKGHDPHMQRLLLYDIDSKEVKTIYEGDKYYYPKISPDGEFIAVSVYRTIHENGMYFMDLDGENLRKISSVPYHEILEWR